MKFFKIDQVKRQLKEMTTAHSSSGRLAVATGVGAFVGATPLIGFHTVIGMAVAKIFRLNQVAVYLGEQVSLPFFAPLVIFASVQVGYRLGHGEWSSLVVRQFDLQLAKQYMSYWLVGSVCVGLCLALVLGGTSFGILYFARRKRSNESAMWTGASRGNAFGYAVFYHTLKIVGRRGAYAILSVVLPYYLIFAPKARRASHQYLDRWRRYFQPDKPQPSWWQRQRQTWKHFFSFGQAMIDDLLLTANGVRSFDRSNRGFDNIQEAFQSGKGVLLLSGHVGSRNIAGQSFENLPVNLAMFENEAESIRKFLLRISQTNEGPKNPPPRIIALNDGPAASVELISALRRGEIVAMLADRFRHGPTMKLKFLGEDAHFPFGVFMLATIAQSPVVFTFAARRDDGGYHFFAAPSTTVGFVSREDREEITHDLAQMYVNELEGFVKQYPYQWYNFYDFWQDQ